MYEGTTFTAIVDASASNLACEREPSDKHDRYAVAVSLAYGLAQLDPLSQGAYQLKIINR